MADTNEQDVDETVEIQEKMERRMTLASQQAQSTIKEGDLHKQGGFMKSWKKRWVVLVENSLAYYDKVGGKIKGGVLLETVKMVRIATELESKKPHCMAIETTTGRTYLFHSTSDLETKEWMTAIQSTVDNLKNDKADDGASTTVSSIGTLYGMAGSPNTVGLMAFFESAGLSYEFENVNLKAGETRTPEFIAMNPNHAIPTFKGADGFIVFEETAIYRYICNKYPAAAVFYPDNIAHKTRVDMALSFRVSDFYKAISTVAYPYLKFGQENAEVQGSMLKALLSKNEGLDDGVLSILEHYYLKDRKYIAGDDLSIADFVLRGVLLLTEGTKGKEFEIVLSDRIQQYLTDVDSASKFPEVSTAFRHYVRFCNGKEETPLPPKEETDTKSAESETNQPDVLEKIKAIKESHPGNLAIKHFDETYYNSLSDEEKPGLLQCINSGVVNEDSGMGCYAMQPADYDRFKPFFSKVLAEYHKVAEDAKHTNNWSLEGVEGLPEGGKLDLAALGLPELSMRVRVGRNLKEFPLPGAMTKDDRIAMESKMCEAFEKLKAMPEYGGGYNSLTPDHANFIDQAAYQKLVDDHIMFKDMAADSYLAAAGIAADWPYGRGCYVSEDRGFVIWVGEEDHLRIMCMKKGSLLNEVFDRLKAALDVVNSIEGLEFAMSEDYGVVTSCPTNLGTGMRASVHIPIPNLTKDGTDKTAKEICKPLGLSVRGTGGEHTPIGADGTCDISPSARFCISEAEIITALYNGLKLLKEKEEEAGK